MTIRLQLFINIFLLIVMCVVVFFVNQRLSKQVLDDTIELNNSEVVIRNSNMLHKKMIEMQSGFRGFLLTEKEIFLSPYYTGLDRIPKLMKDQRSMVTADYQKKLLDTIDEFHKRWVEYADSLILSKKDTLPESNKRYQRLFNEKLKTEVGKKFNDLIRNKFVQFDNYEYKIRKERRADLQNSIKYTRYIALVISIGSVTFVLLSGLYLVRSISKRISKMVHLSERISRGDFIKISDEKKDEFSRLVDALNQMSVTLDKTFKELKQKNNDLDQFAYVVSHDLKAPLRGIANIISWMEEDYGGQISVEIENNLNLIKGRTQRLENMINGLLEYARVEKYKVGNEQVDVNALLEDIKDLIVPENVELIVEKLPVVYTEKLHLYQVFSNLISNGFKHNKNNTPRIVISGRETEEHYEFSVSDNGQGIEKEYFEKIFVIFQTLQERDAFESTGVGLAIVKKIIDDNKGKIKVESTLGVGTTFIFTLPKTQANEKENIAG